MFAFRMVMVARVGDQVYSDEQEFFKCNTQTPGCDQVLSTRNFVDFAKTESKGNFRSASVCSRQSVTFDSGP